MMYDINRQIKYLDFNKQNNNYQNSYTYSYNQNSYSYKNNLRNIFCVNCGEKGHIVKDCLGPITSFGIIAFKKVNSELDEKYDTNDILKNILIKENSKVEIYPKNKFLMIQRKDTMGYIDFIRGKYDSRIGHEEKKSKKIKTCLNEMTKTEKHALITKDFDTLWNNLWVNKDSRLYKNEYELAKKKFSTLNIQTLVKNSVTTFTFQEFGFPKGRRNMKETNFMCAEREFYEETGYDKNCYDFIKEYPKITEEFLGTNDVQYKHIYYLVKMKDNVQPPTVDLENKMQTGEVRNIGWFTLNECLTLMRPYDIAKKNVIKKVHNDIVNMNEQLKCSTVFHSKNSSKELSLYKLNEKYTESPDYLIESQFN